MIQQIVHAMHGSMQALLDLGADPRVTADDGAYPEQVTS